MSEVLARSGAQAAPERQLSRLFSPRSIAVVGASAAFEKAGSQLVHALRGFPGALYPINPSAAEIQGFKAYPSLADLPQPPDLVALAVPGPATPAVMAEAVAAGAGGALIISGGFAESGPAGADLQARVVEVARAGGVRLLGPNTSGFFRPLERCFATFAPGTETIPAGRVAVVAQSGGVNLTLAFLLARAGLGVSLAVGLGNAPDVDAADLLDYLAGDPGTAVIGLHLEGVPRGLRLFEAIRRASVVKPVVALTVGRSDSVEFAQSHTGALLGGFALKLAALRQAGAVVVETTDALVDACAALSRGRLAPKMRPAVALVTAQAGTGLLVTDNLRAAGVDMPQLSAVTQERIAQLLPPITYIKNPVDTGRPGPSFPEVLAAVAAEPEIDLVCVCALNEPQVLDPPKVLAEAAAAAAKPILYAGQGAAAAFDVLRAQMGEAGLAAYDSPDRMVCGALALVADAQARWRAQRPVLRAPPAAAALVLDGRLDEDRAKQLLESAGVTCPARIVCADRAAARAAFETLGIPVVVKVLDAGIPHKTEVGGVHVGVRTIEALEAALDRIDAIPGAAARVYLLEAMAPPGLELIVGGVRDSSFGPVVLVGLGGVLAEALQDVSRRLAPITAEEAEDMLDELAGCALLQGWRGAPPVDRTAVVGALLAVSDLLVAHPDLAEVEINPFRAYADGGLALDALVIPAAYRTP